MPASPQARSRPSPSSAISASKLDGLKRCGRVSAARCRPPATSMPWAKASIVVAPELIACAAEVDRFVAIHDESQ
jgi:hypothetical protein